MAEEIKAVESGAEEKPEEKQTNKEFTQSDFDKALARESRRLEDKYKGFNEIKLKLDTLEKEKTDKELSEKSELEKREAKITALNDQLANINKEYEVQKKINLRNEVLNQPKYKDMPRVYKHDVILSDDRDAIIENADLILKEFENDLGKNKETFGLPKAKGNGKEEKQAVTLADRVRKQIASHYPFVNKE